jgi:hypothetical protein
MGLEKPDTITASAISAREQISRALADRIRQLETGKDLEHVAEDVLPQIEKFLESPEERRLRRVRAGVVCAAVGLGGALLIFLMSLKEHDLLPFTSLGVILFLIGIGLVINGFAFTIPRKRLADRSEDARAQEELESRARSTFLANQLTSTSQTTNDLQSSNDRIASRPSVTEHTTHQLRPNKT